MGIPKLTDLSEKDVKGKRVLVRAEFNVPVKHGEIADDFRIRKALPTISFLKSRSAKTVLISHISNTETDSLKLVYEYLSKSLDLQFAESLEELPSAIDEMDEGDVVFLENLRRFEGEKSCNSELAEQLSEHADMYVNDAFSVSHRPHCSIIELPKHLPSYGGLQFIEELENLSRVCNPSRPFLLLLGGAKFETKLPLARSFVGRADTIYIAGALSNPLYKAKGYEVGKSLMPEAPEDYSGILSEESIVLPQDVIIQNAGGVETKRLEELESRDDIVDIGPQSLEELTGLVEEASFIVWNGPLGYIEGGFDESTRDVARIIAESPAESIVGGGDTLAAIADPELEEEFSFLSTAGGAMIGFLSTGTLPGIEALQK